MQRQEEAALLFEAVLHANRSHLKRLLCQLLQQAPASLVSSLLQTAVQLGVVGLPQANPSHWQLLSDHVCDAVFQWLQDFERLTIAERVCRRWRDANVDGAGWRCWSMSKSLARVSLHRLKALVLSGRLDSTHTMDAEWLDSPRVNWLSGLRLRHLRVDVERYRDKDLKRLVPLAPTLESLDLVYEADHLSSHGLAPLAALTQLRSIELHDNAHDVQLRALSELPLTCVNLENTTVTAAGLPYLPMTLTKLAMRVGQMCGLRHIRQLQRFPHLTELHLGWKHQPPVWTQSDLDAFLNLPCCSERTLKALGVTLAPCVTSATLSQLAFLHALELSMMHPSDEQVEALARLDNVTWLELYADVNGALTDRGLVHLGRLPSKLDTLWLYQLPNVSDSGLAHLQNVRVCSLRIAECGSIVGPGVSALTQVRHLKLQGLRIPTQELLLLSSMPRLESLKILDMIDDACHETFKQLAGRRTRVALRADSDDEDEDE